MLKIAYIGLIEVSAHQKSGNKCVLYVDGLKVAEGKIPKTQPFIYSADEGIDVGMDNETNVSTDYKEGDNKFTGKIKKITVDIGKSQLSDVYEKKVKEAEVQIALSE